jgi:hypothetical protein
MTKAPVTGRLSRAEADFQSRVAVARRTGGSPLVVSCDEGVRLPSSFLAVERRTPSARWSFTGLSAPAAVALGLLDCQDVLGVAIPEVHAVFVADPPCRVELSPEGLVTVYPVASVATHPLLGSTMAHAWIEGLVPVAVVVDLAAIQHLTSVVIAWQLQLLQNCRPAPFSVRNANPGVTTQLKQLRLDYLMALG